MIASNTVRDGTNRSPVLTVATPYVASTKMVGAMYNLYPASQNLQPGSGCGPSGMGLSDGCVVYGPPVMFPWDISFNTLRCYVTTGVSGASVRVGIYSVDLATGLPVGSATPVCTFGVPTTNAYIAAGTLWTSLSRNTPYVFAYQFSAAASVLYGYVNPGWNACGTADSATPLVGGVINATALTSAGVFANGFPIGPTFTPADIKQAASASPPTVFIVCAA